MVNKVEVDVLVETKAARKSIDRLEKSFTDFAKSAKKETDKATGAFDVFAGVISAQAVSSIFKSITSSVIDFGVSSVRTAAKIEGLTTQLTTLTGSTANAKAILEDLTQFAATTPFQLEGLAQTTKKLLSFGFAQDEIIGKLTELGDVAAGSGVDIQELALIYGQVNAASKLTGERLLQLQERAVPIGPALAKTMGVAETAIKDLVSRGEVDFATFEKAFASLSQEGGQFFQGMIRQSKTFDGVMSTLGDNIELVEKDIGDGLLPTIKTLASAFIGVIQSNKGLAKSFGVFLDGKLNEGVDLLIDSIIPLGSAVVFLSDVFNGLVHVWDALKIGINEIAKGWVMLAEVALGAAKSISEALGIDTTLIDQGIEATKVLRESMDETTTEIVAGMGERVKSQGEFARTVESVTQKVTESAKIEIAAERAKTKALEEESNKKSEIKKKEADKVLTESEQIAAKVAEIEKKKSEAVIQNKANEIVALAEMEQVEADRKEEERVVRLELDTEQADTRLEELSSRLGKEEAIKSEAEARRLDKEGKIAQAKKKRQATDLKADKQNILEFQKFENLTNKQKIQNVQSTLGQISTLTSSNNKTLFNIGRASAISDATIRGFQAVQVALSSAPPPFNFALASLVGIATAANVSKIASTKPPGFAGGGVVGGIPQDRDNQLIGAASGEVVLNRRQTANTLFGLANNGALGGGGGSSLNINVEAGVGGISTEQIDFLIDSINDRTEFGNQELRTA